MTDTKSQEATENTGTMIGEKTAEESQEAQADGSFSGEKKKPEKEAEDAFTAKYPPPIDLGNDSNAADFFINQIISGKLFEQMIPRIEFSLKMMSSMVEGASDSLATMRDRVREIRERSHANAEKRKEIAEQKKRTAEQRKKEEEKKREEERKKREAEKKRKEEEKKREEERKKREAEAKKKNKQNPKQMGLDASSRKTLKDSIARGAALMGKKKEQQKQSINNWKTLQRNLVQANSQARGRNMIRQKSRGGRD